MKLTVYTLLHWPEGQDLTIDVFTDLQQARVQARIHAIDLWDEYVESDWPIQPETFGWIYAEILDRTNTSSQIEIREHEIEITPETYFVGTPDQDDTGVLCETLDQALVYAEDLITDGYSEPSLHGCFEIPLEVATIAKVSVR